jgi:hypothetical protein
MVVTFVDNENARLMLTRRSTHPLTEYLTDAKSETAEADT